MGSLANHLELMEALDAYDSSARAASFLGIPEGWTNEEQKYLHLVSVARVCGYEWTTAITTHEWARKQVASFIRNCPNNAAEAGRELIERLAADLAQHHKGAGQ